MDHLKELQAEVDRAADLADDLAVSVMQTDAWATILHDAGDTHEPVADGLRGILLEVAECHDDTCHDVQCCLCEHLRNGVALVLAASRAELDEELERRMRYDPEQVRRRPKLIPRADPGE